MALSLDPHLGPLCFGRRCEWPSPPATQVPASLGQTQKPAGGFFGGTYVWSEDRGRPRTLWGYYISRLAWERIGVLLEELETVAGETDVLVTYSVCRHRDLVLYERQKIDSWMDDGVFSVVRVFILCLYSIIPIIHF